MVVSLNPTLQMYPEILYLSIIPTQSWSLGPTHLQGTQTKRDHPLNQGQVMSKPRVVFLPRQSAVTGQGPVEN